jgi:two-component system response regulator AtoC
MRIETQDPTLTTASGDPGADPGELRLLVSADGVLGAHFLGGRATVRLGRGGDNDIDVPHPSVSRRHAELVLDPLAVRDLGSSNGTQVRGKRITPGQLVPVAVGEAVSIGDVAVLIHRVARGEPRPHGEARFERLAAAAAARAARTGTGFAIGRVHGAADAVTAEVLRGLIGGAAGAIVVHDDGPGQCDLLLIDADAAHAAAVTAALGAALAAAGAPVRVGVATWPHDGVSAEQLVARAWQRAAGDAGAPAAGMDGVRALVAQVADSALPVLIRGETGVGKELCAEMIHRLSARRARSFLKVHCGALGDGIVESELFGVAGAPGRPGLLEMADGGTVFFDEIGDMPLALQAKLLHVLEARAVRRVGDAEPRPLDVRVVAATHRLLEREVAQGHFRQDLYFRLAGVAIEVPPLRARPGELESLARTFARFASSGPRRTTPAIEPDAIDALRSHVWPGNVRELRHTIERSILLCGDGPLRGHHLRIGALPASVPATLHPGEYPVAAPARPALPLHDQVADLERERIREALDACGGNQSHAARLLGIARGTLRARMREFGLGQRR